MPIIGAFPYTILDGQPVDAVPVMADFNWLRNQVNANVPALIPSLAGTVVFVSTVGGTGNNITLTPTSPIASYTAGQSFRFVAIGDLALGGATVNVSGLGTKALQTATGQPMTGGELKSGGVYDITYDGTAFQVVNDAQGSGTVSWTPTITFGGGATGITYTTQLGFFYKLGALSFYSADVKLSNKGSSVGGIQIEGMPVFANAGGTCNGGFLLGCSNVTFGTQVFLGAGVDPGANAIKIFKSTSGGTIADLQDSDCSNTSEFLVAGFFTA
jgi:hypothetical protein